MDPRCVGSAKGSPTGGGLFRSGLVPPGVGVGAIARIYLFDSVGRSTVGSAIYCAGMHVLFRLERLVSRRVRGWSLVTLR